MICQHCHEREARIHVKRVVNGKRDDIYLCDRCAAERNVGFTSSKMSGSHTLWNDLLDAMLPGSALFGLPFTDEEQTLRPRSIVCPACGETEAELRKTGLLGCRHCYDTFAQLLTPVFQKAHGHTRHVKNRFEDSRISISDEKARSSDPESSKAGGYDMQIDVPFRFVHAGERRSTDDNEEISAVSEIMRLRTELQEAVKTENYEFAAQLRDAIYDIEKTVKADKTSEKHMNNKDMSSDNRTNDDQDDG